MGGGTPREGRAARRQGGRPRDGSAVVHPYSFFTVNGTLFKRDLSVPAIPLHGAWLPGGSRTKYIPLAPQTGVASAKLTQWVSRELEINSPWGVIHFELPGGSWEPEINSPWGVINF